VLPLQANDPDLLSTPVYFPFHFLTDRLRVGLTPQSYNLKLTTTVLISIQKPHYANIQQKTKTEDAEHAEEYYS
jgi:hypothetical protein